MTRRSTQCARRGRHGPATFSAHAGSGRLRGTACRQARRRRTRELARWPIGTAELAHLFRAQLALFTSQKSRVDGEVAGVRVESQSLADLLLLVFYDLPLCGRQRIETIAVRVLPRPRPAVVHADVSRDDAKTQQQIGDVGRKKLAIAGDVFHASPKALVSRA